MFRLPSRLVMLPLTLALLAVAGCGTQSATKKSTATAPTQAAAGVTPGATTVPTPVPTPVVSGGAVAAVVNGQSVPIDKFRTLATLAAQQSSAAPGGVTPKALTTEVMNQVVIDELVRQYAARNNIRVTSTEVQQAESQQAAALGGHAGLLKRLKQFGIGEASFQELIRSSLLGQKVMTKIAPLKPVKLTTTRQLTATVRHILIMTKPPGKKPRTDAQALARAQMVLRKVKGGGNFAALARQYSDDTGSATRGGVYSGVTKGQMVPSFDKATFGDKLRQPRIIKSPYGYHVIEVLSRGMARVPNTTAQQQAQQQAQQRQQTAFMGWVRTQEKSATIKKIARVDKP